MNEIYSKAKDAAEWILTKSPIIPEVGVILGTGMSNVLKEHVSTEKEFKFSEVPNFPSHSETEHDCEFHIGYCGKKPTIVQIGRLHYYEGYSLKETTFSIRVLKLLGVKTLFIFSAVGGIDENFEAGDVALITDHINLFPENPLRGNNDDRFGTRYPDMFDAYDRNLISRALDLAQLAGVQLTQSIYAGVPGPSLETGAEYHYLKTIGANVVGMSTVPEVIVARHIGLKVCVFGGITNKCFPTSQIKKMSIEEIIKMAEKASKSISPILSQLIKET